MKMQCVEVIEIYLDHIKFSLEMIQRAANHKMPVEQEFQTLLSYVSKKIAELDDKSIDLEEIFKRNEI